MNLTQLKYFQAVYTYKTVSSAAEYLHISQPSLSNAIKELEREFKISLFTRQSRGMVPTKAGEKLFEMSQKLVSMSETTENIMKDMGKGRKTLRLGIPPMIGSIMLPEIYRNFLNIYDDIQLEITESGQQELIKYIRDGFVDMAILPHNYPLYKSFESKKISDLEIVCCAARENPISKYKELVPSDIKNIPLVLFKDGFLQTEEIKKWFSDSKVTENILLQTSQLSTILSLISSDIAVGFMFRQIVSKNSNLVEIPLKNSPYVDVSLVWKKDSYLSDNMKKFKNFICKN